jgi:hypothetical protein
MRRGAGRLDLAHDRQGICPRRHQTSPGRTLSAI